MQLHLARVFGFAAAELQFIDHAGRGGDQVEVELAGQAFLDDFQMEEAKETAAEAEADRRAKARRLRSTLRCARLGRHPPPRAQGRAERPVRAGGGGKARV